MVRALKEIPDGSGVLIVANSGNLFGIMSEMGVDTNDSMPCKSKKCFDSEAFDNIWHVTVSGDSVTMTGSKYCTSPASFKLSLGSGGSYLNLFQYNQL